MNIGISFDNNPRGYARFGKETFEKIKSLGFSTLDYNISDASAPLYRVSVEELAPMMRERKSAIESVGLSISQTHAPFRWPPKERTEEEQASLLVTAKRAVLATHLLGCPYVVFHPLMPYGTEDRGTANAKETWEINFRFMTELLKTAKQYDVTLCLENMPLREYSIATAEETLNFVKAIGDEHFGMCLDTGHAAVFTERSIGDDIRMLGNHLKVMHVHDNMGNADSHLWPSKGILDWNAITSALRDIGYSGSFSLETCPSMALEDDDFARSTLELIGIAKGLTASL